MKTRPRPFQWEVIRRIDEHNGRCFCFLDRGTGKTFCTLAYIAIHPELRPALIVCPSSLKINWKKEAKKHAGLPAIIYSGQTPQPGQCGGIHIINYDILQYWMEALLGMEFKFIAFDEVQALKTMESIRSKACKRLSMHIPQAIALSGTPITSRPLDFFNIAHTIVPDLFTNKFSYMYRYCGAQRICGALQCKGATNVEELHEKIKPYMIRVRKDDVLDQLPTKNIQVIPVELTNKEAYDKQYADFLEMLAEMRRTKTHNLIKIYTEYGKILQLLTAGKLDPMQEWVDNRLDSNDKLVFFTTHTAPLHAIYERHKKKAVMIDGSVSMKKRDKAVEAFQNNPKITLFCGNIIAAGTGLTLTAANNVAFGELSHIPADHLQAQDRIIRIGQESKHVNIYYLVADNTIEEKMCDKLLERMVDIDNIIDGKLTDSHDLDLRKELFLALKH